MTPLTLYTNKSTWLWTIVINNSFSVVVFWYGLGRHITISCTCLMVFVWSVSWKNVWEGRVNIMLDYGMLTMLGIWRRLCVCSCVLCFKCVWYNKVRLKGCTCVAVRISFVMWYCKSMQELSSSDSLVLYMHTMLLIHTHSVCVPAYFSHVKIK